MLTVNIQRVILIMSEGSANKTSEVMKMFNIKIENLTTNEKMEFNDINEAFWYYENTLEANEEIEVAQIQVDGTLFKADIEQLEMWYDSSATDEEITCMVWLVDNNYCDNCHDSAYEFMNENCFRIEAHSEEEAFKEYLDMIEWFGGIDEKILYYIDYEKLMHDFRCEATYVNHINGYNYLVINN